MNKAYYTVDQISEMLNIHPKTIQRYIREGKLGAIKVGKGWRIDGHDLSAFLERNDVRNEHAKGDRAIAASSVIDIATYGIDDAMRIMNFLTAALVSQTTLFQKSTMQSQYIERENMVRVTLWGEIGFVSAMIDMMMVITEKDEKTEGMNPNEK